jgi:leucyl aminopeptidase
MLLILTNNIKDAFKINNNEDVNNFLLYKKNDKSPKIVINIKNNINLLNILYDISFNFKINNYKNKDIKLYVVCKHNNINNYINLINNCIDAIELTNLPSNIATPKYMAYYVKKLFKKNKDVKVKILSKSQIKKENLNLLYNIGKGNSNPPYFVIIERIIKKKPLTCILGKGITFDSGGVTIKPGDSEHLTYMKMDKLGASYGIHILKHLIDTTKLSLVGLFPFTYNIINKFPLNPGDVIKSHNKKLVEITDTDAEGRLVIADTLSYSHKYKPNKIIDICTLTDFRISCNDHGTFFTQNKKYKDMIEEISYKLKEKIVGLPSFIDKDVLKSNVGDIKNYSNNCNDTYNAAMFLHEFIPKNFKNWIHFDISNELYTENDNLIPNGKVFRTITEIIKK